MPPQALHIVGTPITRPLITEELGLHYRKDVDCESFADSLVAGTGSLQDYQFWVDNAWKQEHGTPEAAGRFLGKLIEERGEFHDATLDCLADSSDDKRKEVDAEAGDVLWCATAIASLATADLDQDMKTLLFEYNHGVGYIDLDEPHHPAWQPEAGNLSVQRSPLLTLGIDGLVDTGFEPLASTARNIDRLEDDGDVEDHLVQVLWTTEAIANRTRDIFALDEDDPTLLLPEAIRQKSEVIGDYVARLYLEIAFIVARTSGSTLTDVISRNVTKLSGRIAEGKVDKSDGPRT